MKFCIPSLMHLSMMISHKSIQLVADILLVKLGQSEWLNCPIFFLNRCLIVLDVQDKMWQNNGNYWIKDLALLPFERCTNTYTYTLIHMYIQIHTDIILSGKYLCFCFKGVKFHFSFTAHLKPFTGNHRVQHWGHWHRNP